MTDGPILFPNARWSSERGTLEADGERLILIDALHGFSALRDTLSQEFGPECQAEMFYRSGAAAFRPLFDRLHGQGLTESDWLERALAVVAQRGYGLFQVQESDLSRGWLVLESANAAEGWAAERTADRIGPCCDFTRGLLRGMVQSYLSGQAIPREEIEAVEGECRANGDASCRFLIGLRSDLTARGWRIGSAGVTSVRETLLRLNRQIEEVLEASQRDALTGLYNRAYFDADLQKRVDYAGRSTDVFSVALIDVDRFKEINDTQGHAGGDVALRRIAASLAALGRGTDLIARYGGDEFAWIMPATGLEAALRVAERIRRRVESEPISEIPLTLSIGVASCPTDAATLPELMRSADQAMYRIKAQGGNGVAGPPR